MAVKVSVYCLVYNHEEFIRDALEGFVSQKTDFEYEVVVHDDASTDRSADIIREYAEKYPDIIKPIFQTENQYSKGFPIISKIIMPRMTGEYIASCEGDDFWTDPMKLQMQVDFLDSHPDYTACVHNTYRLDMKTNRKTAAYPSVGDRDLEMSELLKGGGSCYQTSSLLYRSQYGFNKPEFFVKAKTFGDYPMAIYLGANGKIRFIDRLMSTYRYGTAGSWTRRTSFDKTKLAQTAQYKVDMLDSFNEYSNGKYKSEVDRNILRYKYQILEFKDEFKAMMEEPFRELYKQESLSRKVKLFVKHHFGTAYYSLRSRFKR